MFIKQIVVYIFLILFFLIGCKKDDEVPPPEINDYSDQLIIDDNLLEEFLKSHFYNYDEFSSNSLIEIKIDTISGENSNKTPLYDQIIKKVVSVTDSNENKIDHTLYYLIARQGVVNQKPSIVDSIFLNYKGYLINREVFDQRNEPVWFDLPNLISGFRHGIKEFNPGNYEINFDGTVTFKDFGQGIIFMPSGLGYFSSSQIGIPDYSPLIFTVSLYTVNQTDHDFDGIASIDEDVDGDGEPKNDDTDGNFVPNMFDDDDDGDGILTINEYDENNDGIPDDSDSDSIPDYLDAEG